MLAACWMSGRTRILLGQIACAARVHRVCSTCAPRVHLYFTGISEQWSGQGLPHYYEMIPYLSLRAQIQDVRENTGAHVVHTWCTRAAHVVHTRCTRGSSVCRQCVNVGAVGSGAQRQIEVSWRPYDVVLMVGLTDSGSTPASAGYFLFLQSCWVHN